MQKFLGAIIVLMCVFGGYMWAGGKLLAIWQPAEIMIIVGAALGSVIIGNPPQVLKEMRRQLGMMVSQPKDEQLYYMELILSYKFYWKPFAVVASNHSINTLNRRKKVTYLIVISAFQVTTVLFPLLPTIYV